MTPSVISRWDLLRDGKLDRLDAEYFDPDRIGLEERIKDGGGVALSTLAYISEVRVPDRRKAREPDDTFRYVEIGHVDGIDGFSVADDVLNADAPSRARLQLRTGIVALSSVRPIRNQVLLVFPDLDGALASTGFVSLKAKAGFSPEVLFVLLKTRHAIAQLDRRARASMYPALNPPEVLELSVPQIPPNVAEEVRDLVLAAGKQRAAFLKHRARATALADAIFEPMQPERLEVDLKRHEPRVRSRSNVMKLEPTKRLDAEFYAPAFDAAIDRMKKMGPVVSLGSISARLARGRSPKASEFSEEDTGDAAVLKLAALSGFGVQWSALSYAPPRYIGDIESRVVEGDILFNSTAHEPNYVAHRLDVVGEVPTTLRGRLSYIADLTQIRINDADTMAPHYVAAFLRNALGRLQIRRCIRGVRAHVYPEDVAAVVQVPVPKKSVAAEITREAERAETCRWRYRDRVSEAIDVLNAHFDRSL